MLEVRTLTNRVQTLDNGASDHDRGKRLMTRDPEHLDAPPSAVAAVIPEVIDGIAWYDVRQWGVEGRGWQDTEACYDRLPRRARTTVRPELWELSRHSAGMAARFDTDATTLHARYMLRSDQLAMSHMPATGVSGLDLYACDDEGRERWLAVTRPDAQRFEAALADGLDAPRPGAMRTYTAYLPLYNGIEALAIGVPEGARFNGLAPRTSPTLVFYGTSIMQGACASRPGMAISAILGRRLARPVINLGFSGNGVMEQAVGALMAELTPAAYIIDCLPNMDADTVAERTEPLVCQLRAARPEVPVLLVEDRTSANASWYAASRSRHLACRAALRAAFDRLTRHTGHRLHYLQGHRLIGDDGEGTTDGSHPNDLGMRRYADAYEHKLREILAPDA